MKIISLNDVRDWYDEAGDLAEFTRSIGRPDPEAESERQTDLPPHLQLAVECKARELAGPVPVDAFDSLPFYSLCRGFFLPLSGLSAERIAQVFGILVPPVTLDRGTLLRSFLDKEVGLTLLQKIGCVMGDPFLGKRSTFRRDSLIRLLRSMRLMSRNDMLDRLTRVGDVAILFAENMAGLKSEPPLTALEVLETLRCLPGVRAARKMNVLRSLFERCGKLEAYFLVKLLLRSAGLGFDYQGPLLAQVLGERFHCSPEQVEHAMALTDPIHVARVLMDEGAEGLRKIQLRPLSPVRPALAGGTVEDIKKYPVWIERKYDGIRLLLHKDTDTHGSMLCGAYTRNRGDWLESIPGLQASIRMLPARSVIVDGELYGTVVGLDGARPASVYEVYCMIQGEPVRPVQLKFAGFDVLYLNGQDLTRLPLGQRRQCLASLLAPLSAVPLQIPLVLSEGHMANAREDVNRLFHHFRNQGYEGIIGKDWNGPYHLATRDPAWVKRKPEITLDLVLLAGVLAVTAKENAGMFGSYVIGARTSALPSPSGRGAASALPSPSGRGVGGEGAFEDVGDVAGVDRVRDQHIQSEVMRLGLLTGRRIERPSASGVRPGLEFRPALVVTVKFEGIIRDHRTGKLSLRDPKIALIRSDKSAFEADDVGAIEKLFLGQHFG